MKHMFKHEIHIDMDPHCDHMLMPFDLYLDIKRKWDDQQINYVMMNAHSSMYHDPL